MTARRKAREWWAAPHGDYLCTVIWASCHFDNGTRKPSCYHIRVREVLPRKKAKP
jgi:hypothetical protein